jgi:hypothetical protein
VLDGDDGPSSLAASLSTAVKLLEGRVDVVAANRVHWGTRSALVVTVSHIPELETKLELLELGATWTWWRIRWMHSRSKRVWPQTQWHCTSFLRLHVALLGILDSDVRWHLLATARGHLPAA